MWILVAATGLVFVSGIVLAKPPSCPPSNKISPCYCGDGPYFASIYCNSLKGLEELKPILEATRGFNLSYDIERSKLGDIPSDFFQGQLCSDIVIMHSEITSLGQKPFTGLETTLKKIDIYESVNEDLGSISLGHLKNLEVFSFEGNDLTILSNDWFADGSLKLKELMLEANEIQELGDRAFASLLNLEHIWLGENELEIISRSMFPQPANKLSIFEIRDNGIKVLPDDLFTGMPALISVNVEGNQLKTLPETTWSRIWGQLEEVFLEDNDGFKCDKRLKWIYTKGLPQTLRGKCPPGDKFEGKNLKDLRLEDFDEETY